MTSVFFGNTRRVLLLKHLSERGALWGVGTAGGQGPGGRKSPAWVLVLNPCHCVTRSKLISFSGCFLLRALACVLGSFKC